MKGPSPKGQASCSAPERTPAPTCDTHLRSPLQRNGQPLHRPTHTHAPTEDDLKRGDAVARRRRMSFRAGAAPARSRGWLATSTD